MEPLKPNGGLHLGRPGIEIEVQAFDLSRGSLVALRATSPLSEQAREWWIAYAKSLGIERMIMLDSDVELVRLTRVVPAADVVRAIEESKPPDWDVRALERLSELEEGEIVIDAVFTEEDEQEQA